MDANPTYRAHSQQNAPALSNKNQKMPEEEQQLQREVKGSQRPNASLFTTLAELEDPFLTPPKEEHTTVKMTDSPLIKAALDAYTANNELGLISHSDPPAINLIQTPTEF